MSKKLSVIAWTLFFVLAGLMAAWAIWSWADVVRTNWTAGATESSLNLFKLLLRK